MRTIVVSFLLVISCFPVFSQDTDSEGPQPDRWRGLILDQSTPDDAIKVLGQPASDKPTKLMVYRIQSWLTKRTKEKIFRTLEFKKPEGIDKARLVFLDSKLVAIDLDMKKGIAPGALSNIYGIEFQPLVNATDVAFKPRDYEQNK